MGVLSFVKDSLGDMQTEWIRENVEQRILPPMTFLCYHRNVPRNKGMRQTQRQVW